MKRILMFFLLIFLAINFVYAQNERFYQEKSLIVDTNLIVDELLANKIYTYFKDSKLFKWEDRNNCEDRANAIGILLDSWNVPNYKAWIFSGRFLSKDQGLLTDRYGVRWKYHVATVIPIKRLNKTDFVVIDPATTSTETPFTISTWANNVTDKMYSYYILTPGDRYIWTGKGKKIGQNTFTVRNATNYEYTIQGLAGFNGLNHKDRKAMRSAEGQERLNAAQKGVESLKSNMPTL